MPKRSSFEVNAGTRNAQNVRKQATKAIKSARLAAEPVTRGDSESRPLLEQPSGLDCDCRNGSGAAEVDPFLIYILLVSYSTIDSSTVKTGSYLLS